MSANEAPRNPVVARVSPFLAPVIAVLAPVAFFSGGELWSKITRSAPAESSAPSQAPAGETAGETPPEGSDVSGAGRAPHDPAAIPVHQLAEVLRFDISPDWIVRRWPRVSAGLGELQLQGYRVPLVTGTAEDDLAGALTYYFNPRQKVQRITFQGTTGNAHRLAELAAARFGFVRRLANDPGVFLYEVPERDGKARSFLRIRPAQVVKASDPYHRFDVAMLIERPAR